MDVLCPVTPSASHVGFSALRLEPTFMVLGQAAGVAAALAAAAAARVADVNTTLLQDVLRQQGQRITEGDLGPDDWDACGVPPRRAP